MARIRRLAALAGACALGTALIGIPAQADTPEVFAGSAAGRALDLNVLGQPATLGVSTAKVSSGGGTPTAEATGAGQLSPVPVASFQGDQKSSVSGSGSDVKPQACATPTIPPPISTVLNIGLACSATSASITGAGPQADGSGSVATLTLDGQTALAPLAPVTDVVNTTLSTVVSGLCGAIAQTCPVGTTITDLVNSILKTRTLDIALGTSNSSVVTDAGKVTAVGTANGGVIKILPSPVVNGVPVTGEPLVTITVGSAKATAICDRATGTSTPTFDAAIVTIRINTVGTGVQEVKLSPGQTQTILAGTPLESTITVANGSATKNAADGSVAAVADGVRLELLKGLNGGITLGLAHAEAAAGCTPAVVTPKPAPVAPAAGELPRTGGTPFLPIAGAGLLGLVFLVRRTTVRARS